MDQLTEVQYARGTVLCDGVRTCHNVKRTQEDTIVSPSPIGVSASINTNMTKCGMRLLFNVSMFCYYTA